MPSIYAHNKFGKLVLAKLPDREREIIKKYPRSYRIGLQGPDFLFFYRAISKNKINQIGVTYHHRDAYDFIKNALDVVAEYGKDSAQYSYLLGLLCHLGLDSVCHPYVYEAMKQTGCGHCEIEGDFDQLLLSQDGHTSESYPLAKLIPTDFDTALSIVDFYDGVTLTQVQESLKWMKFIKKILFAPGIVKRTTLDLIMRASMHYQKLNGHVILPNANEKCRSQSEHLCNLMHQSVLPTIQLISGFNQALEGFPLPDTFHIDFTGKQYSK